MGEWWHSNIWHIFLLPLETHTNVRLTAAVFGTVSEYSTTTAEYLKTTMCVLRGVLRAGEDFIIYMFYSFAILHLILISVSLSIAKHVQILQNIVNILCDALMSSLCNYRVP